MTVENILFAMHNSNEADMLPLSAIKTPEDMERYNNKGYLVPGTYNDWKEKFPGIDADKVVLMNGFNFGIAYYEKENLIYLNLVILVMQNDKDKAKRLEKDIIETIEETRKQVADGTANYLMLLESYPDGLRISGFEQLLTIVGPGEVFYKTFIDMYVVSNFMTQRLPRKLIDTLVESKSETQKAETESRLANRFGTTNTYTAYRGMSEKSANTEDALSWSPNINIAYRFASAFGKEHIVAKAKIRKEDIIEYISPDMSPEEEFIVKPGTASVREMTILSTPDSPDIIKYSNMVLPTYQTYRNKLKKLYQKYGKDSTDHDALHSLRVLLLSLILAAHEGMGKSEYKQLATAAIYHDIGRINDQTDASHGKMSADIYQKDSGADRAVAFLIQYHCIDDSIAKKQAERIFSANRLQKILDMYSIIKDADALDRIRFGFATRDGSDGLDVRYLRNDYAKKLVFFATRCEKELRL